jgi:hypothetical protein
MRILAPNGTSLAAGPAARRTAGSGFAVTEETAPRPTAAAGGPRSVGGIDALIALQGVEDPLERRKRAVKRGRVALEALDELKMALLGGALTTATLAKLIGRCPSQAGFRRCGARRRAGGDRAAGRGRDRQDGAALTGRAIRPVEGVGRPSGSIDSALRHSRAGGGCGPAFRDCP